MKKTFKQLITLACIFSILTSTTAFAAGYEVALSTDIPFSAKSYDYFKTYDNVEETYIIVTEVSNLISNFSNGFAVVYENCCEVTEEGVHHIEIESSYVIDQSGNKVNIGDYDNIGVSSIKDFSLDNIIRTTHFDENYSTGVDMYGGVMVFKDKKYGYVGLKDGIVIPCEHEETILRYDENIFGVNPDSLNLGCAEYFIDATGTKLFPLIDLTPVKKEKGTFTPSLKYLGNNVFAYFYDIVPQENNWPIFKYKYLDHSGNEIKDYIPKIDESKLLSRFDPEALKNYYAADYLDTDEDVLIGHGGIFSNKDTNGKYGLLDENYNVIVPYVYDYISGLQDGYCWAAQNGKWSLLKISTNKIDIQLNGQTVQFDQIPLVINGRTLAPVRAIFEALGATVEWKNDTREVVSTKGDITITMAIDSTTMYKNGNPITLDVAPQIISERTLVPVRAIAEAFDCKVEWNNDTQTVIITE